MNTTAYTRPCVFGIEEIEGLMGVRVIGLQIRRRTQKMINFKHDFLSIVDSHPVSGLYH